MKKTVFTLAIVGAILTIMAFSNSEKKSEGAIGDVKYSILPPDKFQEENGNGWVLMDDKIPLQGSDLNVKHQVLEIPDARGMFIRGLNLNRSDDKSDPFIKESKKKEQRKVGEYQNDAFEKHKHDIYYYQPVHYDFPGTQYAGAVQPEQSEQGVISGSPTGFAGGESTETRPKNLALYVYIKINY